MKSAEVIIFKQVDVELSITNESVISSSISGTSVLKLHMIIDLGIGVIVEKFGHGEEDYIKQSQVPIRITELGVEYVTNGIWRPMCETAQREYSDYLAEKELLDV